jgi:hypothetical protein
MLRRARALANPFTRTAMIAFAWAHRHTILRWGRSFWNELRQPGRIEPGRLMLIGKVLWAITSDERLAKASQLRQVRLEGSTLVVDTARGWKGTAQLVDELSGVEGISAITDARGTPLSGSIATTAIA